MTSLKYLQCTLVRRVDVCCSVQRPNDFISEISRVAADARATVRDTNIHLMYVYSAYV